MAGRTTRDIFAILRKRLVWLIVLPVVAGLAAGSYYKFFAKNEYTAEILLGAPSGYADASGRDSLQLLQSPEVLGAAARALGYASADELRRKAALRFGSAGGALAVWATSGNPVTSRDAANAVGAAFVNYMGTLGQTQGVGVTGKARLPLDPSGPPRARNTALAAAATLLLVAAAALLQGMASLASRRRRKAARAPGGRPRRKR